MMKLTYVLLYIFIFGCLSCKPDGAEPIDIHKDKCEFCKMSISDIRFACELVTAKGRVYKFDDILCANGYMNENKVSTSEVIWISDFDNSNELIAAEKAFYIESDSLRSPMGGDVAAFKSATKADEYAKKFDARRILWNKVRQK